MTKTIDKTTGNIALSKLVNGIYPELFDGIVGQNAPKMRLCHYLRSYVRTRIFPNLILISQKGNGKTKIAREIAKGLLKFDDNSQIELNADSQLPRRKKLVEINCSSLTTVNDFLANHMISYVQDKDVTVFFDEASEIPHDITMSLLTILAPNEVQTTYAYGNYVCQFDFRKQTFVFATSEPQKVFHALLDRLTRIDLQDYTPDELALIIQKGSPDVKYERGVLDCIASVSRGNARNANNYAAEIKIYLGKDKGNFGVKDWNSLKCILGVAPLGLNVTELNILRHLEANQNGVSLTALSAKMGMSREAVQRDGELYLLNKSLISIEPAKGRVLTPKGRDYLMELNLSKKK
jgi:Holliday junction resolvasome RuvABC ATP-dependent DNA helicase subunit